VRKRREEGRKGTNYRDILLESFHRFSISLPTISLRSPSVLHPLGLVQRVAGERR